MPEKGLGQIERRVYFETKINELTSIYKKSEEFLKNKLTGLDLEDYHRYRTERLLTEIRKNIRALNKTTKKWVEEVIPYGYERGFDITKEKMKILNITSIPHDDAMIHTSAVNILMDNTTNHLIKATDSMKKSLTSFIRRTQQTLLQDKEINRMIAQGIITGEPNRTVADNLLKQLRGRMREGKFISIKGRNYKPSAYAELLARTQTREATSQGIMNTALNNDMDLMQISSHAGSCNYCLQFQGRVYSISGNTAGFPMLDEYPPFHPSCAHVMSPVTKDFLMRRHGVDGYKNLKELSNTPKMPDNVSRSILNKHTAKQFKDVKKQYNLVESYTEYKKFLETGRVAA